MRAIERGFTVREVPIVFRDRRHGHSKMSPWIALEAIVVLPAAALLTRRRGTSADATAVSVGEGLPRAASTHYAFVLRRPSHTADARRLAG